MHVQLDGHSAEPAEYSCTYESTTHTIILSGMLRLDGVQEYEEISMLFNTVASQHPPQLTLDIRYLEYLNSSGITTISRFILALRRQGGTNLAIKSSSQMPWQERSMKNLIRLMPDAQLEVV